MENFNLKKFLVENKLTTNSRMLNKLYEAEDDFSFDPDYFLEKVIPRLEAKGDINKKQARDLKELTRAFQITSADIDPSLDTDFYYNGFIDKLEQKGAITWEERDGFYDFLNEYRAKLQKTAPNSDVILQANKIIKKVAAKVEQDPNVEEFNWDILDPETTAGRDVKIKSVHDRYDITFLPIFKDEEEEEYNDVEDYELILKIEDNILTDYSDDLE